MLRFLPLVQCSCKTRHMVSSPLIHSLIHHRKSCWVRFTPGTGMQHWTESPSTYVMHPLNLRWKEKKTRKKKKNKQWDANNMECSQYEPWTQSQLLEPLSAAFTGTSVQSWTKSESDHARPMPVWDASVAGCGLTRCATMMTPSLMS